MKKVLIVDDEPLGRSSIRNLIDWEEFDMEIVGEAEDGELALAIIEEACPQIIITDIRMPFVNGLELLKRIKSKDPTVQVVIVSSYDEFQYAQEAIKYGASAYLLKPIVAEELQEVLINLSMPIDNSDAKISFQAKNASMVQEIYWRLISDSIGVQEARAQIDAIDPNISNSYFKVVMYLLDGCNHWQQTSNEILDKAIKHLRETVPSEYGGGTEGSFTFETSRGVSAVQCFWGKNPHKLDALVETTIAQIRNILEEYSLSIVVGESCLGLEGLIESRKQAMILLSYRFLLGKNKNIFYREIAQLQTQPGENDGLSAKLDVKKLLDSLSFSSKDELLQGISDIEYQITQQGSSSRFFAMLIMSGIISKALTIVKESGIERELVDKQILQLKQVLFLDTVQESFEGLRGAISDLMDIIIAQRRSKYSVTIQKAKKYIEKNYMKNNLSLQDVAQHLFLSVAYFSILFKRETNSTFLSYLTKIRMEKARELLMTNAYTIYNISEAVGYDNPTYFSTLFKKYYGLSPRDYKNRYGQPE